MRSFDFFPGIDIQRGSQVPVSCVTKTGAVVVLVLYHITSLNMVRYDFIHLSYSSQLFDLKLLMHYAL